MIAPIPASETEFITSVEMAEQFGINRKTVCRWCRRGWLDCYQTEDGFWMIDAKSAEAVYAERSQACRRKRQEYQRAVLAAELTSQPSPDDETEFVPISEAASRLEACRSMVAKWCRLGWVDCYRDGWSWMVNLQSVAERIERNRDRLAERQSRLAELDLLGAADSEENERQRLAYVPTPEEIAAECAVIQSEWNETQRESHATVKTRPWELPRCRRHAS